MTGLRPRESRLTTRPQKIPQGSCRREYLSRTEGDGSGWTLPPATGGRSTGQGYSVTSPVGPYFVHPQYPGRGEVGGGLEGTLGVRSWNRESSRNLRTKRKRANEVDSGLERPRPKLRRRRTTPTTTGLDLPCPLSRCPRGSRVSKVTGLEDRCIVGEEQGVPSEKDGKSPVWV